MNPILHAILFYAAAYLSFMGLRITIALVTKGCGDTYSERIRIGILCSLLFTLAVVNLTGFCVAIVWFITHA